MTDCVILRRRILDSLEADDIGLYEVFWEVDGGIFYDIDLGYSKDMQWNAVRDVLIDMHLESEILLKNVKNGLQSELAGDPIKTISAKEKWRPFDINREDGVIVSKRPFKME